MWSGTASIASARTQGTFRTSFDSTFREWGTLPVSTWCICSATSGRTHSHCTDDPDGVLLGLIGDRRVADGGDPVVVGVVQDVEPVGRFVIGNAGCHHGDERDAQNRRESQDHEKGDGQPRCATGRGSLVDGGVGPVHVQVLSHAPFLPTPTIRSAWHRG
jgi:hypothetical protein